MVKPPICNTVEILQVLNLNKIYSIAFKDIILITTSKVYTKRPENLVSRMYCKTLDSIIYILNDPCIA